MARINFNPEIDSANHVMTFGKYRGRSIADVLPEEPGYLCWADDTVEGFDLSARLRLIVEIAIDDRDGDDYHDLDFLGE